MRLAQIPIVIVFLVRATVALGDANAEARAHYERGTSYYALAKYAEAADEYEKAFEFKSDPALLYNAAQAHRMAGHTQRALTLYQSYLLIFGDVKNRDEVERQIAKLKQAIEADERAVQSPLTGTQAATHAAAATRAAPASSATVVEEQANARPPLVRRGWFWGVLGAAVVTVAVGVGVGVGLGAQRDPEPSLGTATWR